MPDPLPHPVLAAVFALNAETARAWTAGARVSVDVFRLHDPTRPDALPVVQARVTEEDAPTP